MIVGSLLTALAVLVCIPSNTHGHGRLLDPPSRMSAWRFGFKVPINYNDHQMYCGGFGNQWYKNGGKCGLCGDPWQGPRDYERPNGKMVPNLVITRTYRQGAVIDIDVEVTANHLGWFEFHICDVRESGGVEATLGCLNKHILADRTGKTRFNIGSKKGNIRFRLRLPPQLTCPQCVLQWKWHCGNNVGYGEKQEEFYACSDVQITASGAPVKVTQKPKPPVTVVRPPVTQRPPKVVVTPRPPSKVVTQPPPPGFSTITNPPLVTIPPNILSLIGDENTPLSQRIRIYVAYQQTVHPNYSIWSENKVSFIPRHNQVNRRPSGSNNNNNNSNNNNNKGTTATPSPVDKTMVCHSCKFNCAYEYCTKDCPDECPMG